MINPFYWGIMEISKALLLKSVNFFTRMYLPRILYTLVLLRKNE